MEACNEAVSANVATPLLPSPMLYPNRRAGSCMGLLLKFKYACLFEPENLIAIFVSMKKTEGILKFDYKGRHMEIPYSTIPDGSGNRVHLTDKKGCIHIVDLVAGEWKPLWSERYSTDFKCTLDWVLKAEFGA